MAKTVGSMVRKGFWMLLAFDIATIKISKNNSQYNKEDTPAYAKGWIISKLANTEAE